MSLPVPSHHRLTAIPDSKRVPLRILYASTTGTGKLLATILQREAFAMNVSGFHFDVTVNDISEYDYVEGLEVRKRREGKVPFVVGEGGKL